MDKRKRGENMEGELLRRKQKMNKNSGAGSNIGHTAYVNCGGVGVDDLLLSDILSRLPVKSLMRFKLVCKHWISIIQHNQYFIDLYNTRSEARQHNLLESNNGTNLFISPVKVCGEKRSTEMAPSVDIKEEEAGTEMKVISFSHDNQGGPSYLAIVHSINTNVTLPVNRRKDPLELVSFDHTSILEPVHGLVCFVNLTNYGSVLICNPSTRDKTSWIRTSTSILLENIFLDQKRTQQGRSLDEYQMRTVYTCMFGFGFDSTTKEHKVLCIYQVDKRELTDVSNYPLYENYPLHKNYYEIYCEVMTVGENTWREIDDDLIPPSMVIGQHDKCVHVNGSIYWMCYKFESEPYLQGRNDVIMAFDVGSETFRVIIIPTFIVEDLCRLDWYDRKYKWNNELLDVDGHIAILDVEGNQCKEGDRCRGGHQCTEGHQWINLWINDQDKQINSTAGNHNATVGSSDAYWIKETLPLPYRWEELKYLAIKAITGTDLIVTKFFQNSCPLAPVKLESLDCYDRKNKKDYEKQVDMITDRNCLYDITTLLETLTHVQNNIS